MFNFILQKKSLLKLNFKRLSIISAMIKSRYKLNDYSPPNEHSKLVRSTEQRARFNTDIILAS